MPNKKPQIIEGWEDELSQIPVYTFPWPVVKNVRGIYDDMYCAGRAMLISDLCGKEIKKLLKQQALFSEKIGYEQGRKEKFGDKPIDEAYENYI